MGKQTDKSTPKTTKESTQSESKPVDFESLQFTLKTLSEDNFGNRFQLTPFFIRQHEEEFEDSFSLMSSTAMLEESLSQAPSAIQTEQSQTMVLPRPAMERVSQEYDGAKNSYHQAVIAYMVNLDHLSLPITYLLNRSKKQNDKSQFWFVADKLKLIEKKTDKAAKTYAKRKDQEYRTTWDKLDKAEKKENDRTYRALRWLGSFPDKADNRELLDKLAGKQKEEEGRLRLIESMIGGEESDSIFDGVNL